MKRKLKIKKTVVRSLTRTRISGAGWGGWNCDSNPNSCDAPCWIGVKPGDPTMPVTDCYCDTHTYGRDTCETCATCPIAP
jgi:hypothetical protein